MASPLAADGWLQERFRAFPTEASTRGSWVICSALHRRIPGGKKKEIDGLVRIIGANVTLVEAQRPTRPNAYLGTFRI